MTITIQIGMATCGIGAGAGETYKEFERLIPKSNKKIILKKTGCIGMCYNEPLVEIKYKDHSIFLKKIHKKDVAKVLKAIETNTIPKKLIEFTINKKVKGIPKQEEHPFFSKQVKLITRNSGRIDPLSIEEYIQSGGFKGLRKALELSPEKVIERVKDAKIRGRGGAGFPTGIKWSFLPKNKKPKYLICNFDEGDPGAFMNRSLVESDPFRLIEGMIIGAYALGINKGFIYIRAEYPLALKTLKNALAQARNKNFLGRNILKKEDFNFDIEIKIGAGAYVCGEETALIESLEGKRGHPRFKPPYPAQQGLFNKPTIINNVGTFAHIATLFQIGLKNYIKYGTEKSKGTKVLCLTGKFKRTGVIEVPLGTKLKTIVYAIGGASKKDIKAIQIGGPSGGAIPAKNLNIKLDYEDIHKTGAIMGSGGIVAISKKTNILDNAKFFMEFSVSESCGKCTPCREGTTQLLGYLKRLKNKFNINEYKEMIQLAKVVKQTSLCGLGQSAPNPILTGIKYFEEDFIGNRKIYKFEIQNNCIGCHKCYEVCPVKTIQGKPGEIHKINQENCIHCGACFNVCKTKAITKTITNLLNE